MGRVLRSAVTWAQLRNGKGTRNAFALQAGDIKDLPTVDEHEQTQGAQEYDFRGKPSPTTHEVVAAFMRLPTTHLPYVRRVSRFRTMPAMLTALQEWHGADGEIVLAAASGPQPVARGTSEDVGRALTLRALRAPADGGRLAPSRSTSASTVPQFVLCDGQVTPDGVPRLSWAASKVCRCGHGGWYLSLRAALPLVHQYPMENRKRCGDTGRTAYERERVQDVESEQD